MKTKPGGYRIVKILYTVLSTLFLGFGFAQAQTIDFQQASNQNHPIDPITWINGILNPNNSDYFEGHGIPQRIIFSGLQATAGDTHELTFRHQALKGGVHAYDFLMGWDQAILTTGAIGQGPTNELQNLMAQQCNGAISADGLDACTSATNVLAIQCPDNMGDPPGISCGFPPNVATNPVIQCFEGIFGNRFIHVYGNLPVTWGELIFNGYTGSGDVYATYTLRWKSASDKVKIAVAGRSSQSCVSSGCCGYGAGCGAGAGSGPTHFKLDELDGNTTGNQDNQLQGILAPYAPVCDSVVINGAITVCPNSTDNIYTTSISGPCSAITHHWSITGAGTIIGSINSASVNVLASNICGGQFSLCDTIVCEEGQVVCCRVVNVDDIVAPSINCPNPATSVECPNTPNFGPATANDACDNSVSIVFDDVITPGSCPQEFSVTRTWAATDDCGNSSTCSRTITVEDNTPPLFSNCATSLDLGLNPIVPDCFNQISDVTDNCTIPNVTCSEGNIINTSATGRMRVLTWTAFDDCGNSSVCTTTFTWIEDTTLQCTGISGPVAVSANSVNNIYTVNYSGTCSNVTHSWSITGNGFIVGPATGNSISVTSANTGQFTICDTVTCSEGQIICCTTVDVIEPLQCISINGPGIIETNSNATYTVDFSGTCSNVSHHWSISGNGSIVGSAVDSFVNVSAGIFGPFTLCDTVTCDQGQIICCAIIDVLDSSSQWNSLNSGVIENLQRIQFPTNNTGYAGGYAPAFPPFISSVIIRTTDEGNSWNSVFSSSIDFIIDFIFHAKRKNNAVTSGSGILKMNIENDTTNWTYGALVPATFVSAFHFINNSVGFAGDNLGNVYKTTNGGNTWSNGTFIGVVSTLESFAFFNNNNGIVVGHDTSVIAKTTDGGNTWNIVSMDYNLKSVYTIQGNAFAVGPDGTAAKSIDNGNTWSPLTVPVPWMNFNSVFCPTNNICYAVGEYGAIIKTSNGGTTWQQQNSATINNLNSIYCINANTCYAAGNNGTILKTTTGGNRLQFSNDSSASEDGFIFYPNPASDALNFIFRSNAKRTITISNTIGQTLIREQTIQKSFSLKINHLSKGVFFISVYSGENIYINKFLKM